jgi:threonine dehydratase
VTSVSLDRIREAAEVIDPVFLNTPQFVCEPLSERLGLTCVLKVETINPIRSFKGRGSDYVLHRLGRQTGGFVCASAGNFGQGMAYAARKRGEKLSVFAATTANPLKVDRMRALGATVILEGADFDEAKESAERFAKKTGAAYVEDGLLAPIAEGAGTIALEMCRMEQSLDAVFVPLGNGALVIGMGAWLKRFSPTTKVIAVCPTGAPAMELSWTAGHAVSTPTMSTIADGIAVRVPVQQALDDMHDTVDEVMLVTDDEILEAMKMLFEATAIVTEPAGAAGLAAIAKRRDELAGKRVATLLTGGNLTADQIRLWLTSPPSSGVPAPPAREWP